MRSRFLLLMASMLAIPACAQSPVGTTAAQQIVPESQPSLAEQAKKAAKPSPSTKPVVDNDAVEKKRREAAIFPDLGAPDLNVYEIVDSIVDYRNTHPAEL